jgi:hypothetical protein
VPFHIGEVGLTYGTVTLVAAGGVKPYKWSISSGALPAGVTLSSKGSATGKPTAVGTFAFVVRVDDSVGGAAGVPTSILVFRQIAFVTTSQTCSGEVHVGCTTTLKYMGGIPNGKPTVKVTQYPGKYPPLPKGSMFSAAKGIVSVTIPPVGCGPFTTGYLAVVTLVLVDQSPCGAGYLCLSGSATLTVRLSSLC